MFLEAVQKLTDRQISLAAWFIEYLENQERQGLPRTPEQFVDDLTTDLEAVKAVILAAIKEKSHAATERSR